MEITLLAFGIAREIVGGSELRLQVPEDATVAELRQQLLAQFPDFQRLTSLRVAVNSEYAEEQTKLQARDEVVLIPPVSGG